MHCWTLNQELRLRKVNANKDYWVKPHNDDDDDDDDQMVQQLQKIISTRWTEK